MKFKFKGNEYTYDELKDANVNLIIDICKSLNMDYKYYAPFLYKNRNIIITEFFNRQRVNDCENSEKKEFVDNKNQSANKQNEKFKYSYEKLLAKDFTDLVDICLSNTVINDNEIYDFSKSELISKLHENFIKPVEEMIIKEKAQQEEIERLEKEESQRRENEKIQQEEREKEELRQEEEREKEELRQREERENEKYNKDEKNENSIENEINKFFADIAKIDIGSILENVNDAIININQDEIINKGSQFAQDVVLGFDEFLEEALKNVQEQNNTQKSEEDIYTPILTLDKNKYGYDFKDKFANAFKRFRTLGKSRCKMLVLSEADNTVNLEKIIFNFEFVDNILHAKCEVKNDIENINADKFDLIFLDENINSTLIKNIISAISDLKIKMLDNEEIEAEVVLINDYINNGEINILLNYKENEKVTQNKIIFYKNIQGESQIIIAENKNECDVRRIKTAKALKLFIKSELSEQETELAKIDFTSIEVSAVLDDKYDKYKNIGELDLIISFKKTDDGKLSYRIFVKQDGQLMYSDEFIIEY